MKTEFQSSWKTSARDLLHYVDCDFPLPVYLVDESDIGDHPHISTAGTYGQCGPRLTALLEGDLRMAGEWVGPGPVLVICSQAIEADHLDPWAKLHGTVLHEFAHVFQLLGGYHVVADQGIRNQIRDNPPKATERGFVPTQTEKEPRPWFGHDDPKWIRACIHLAYRANRAFGVQYEDVASMDAYLLSPLREYAANLGEEPQRTGQASLIEILSSDPQEGFIEFCQSDLKRAEDTYRRVSTFTKENQRMIKDFIERFRQRKQEDLASGLDAWRDALTKVARGEDEIEIDTMLDIYASIGRDADLLEEDLRLWGAYLAHLDRKATLPDLEKELAAVQDKCEEIGKKKLDFLKEIDPKIKEVNDERRALEMRIAPLRSEVAPHRERFFEEVVLQRKAARQRRGELTSRILELDELIERQKVAVSEAEARAEHEPSVRFPKNTDDGRLQEETKRLARLEVEESKKSLAERENRMSELKAELAALN